MYETAAMLLTFGAAVMVGAISPGYLLVRRTRGTDVRDQGSGRTGATNTARLLGPSAFLFVLCADVAKAAVPVGVASLYLPGLADAIAVGVVAGHIWPPTLGLRGGRGVAPALGVIAVLNPILLPILAVLFVVAYVLLRSRRLAAASGFIALAAVAVPLHDVAHEYGIFLTCCMVAVAHLDLSWAKGGKT